MHQLTAITDMLARRLPEQLDDLRSAYPELAKLIRPGRTLGEESAAQLPLVGLTELWHTTAKAAGPDLADTLDRVTRKAALVARIRLGAGIVSATASAGVIVAIISAGQPEQIFAAAVAFGSTTLGLWATYIEDHAGGKDSLKMLREKIALQAGKLADARGIAELGIATADQQRILAALLAMNSVLAEVQYVRARLGMPI